MMKNNWRGFLLLGLGMMVLLFPRSALGEVKDVVKVSLSEQSEEEKDTIELFLCMDEKLEIDFYCNGEWPLETEEDTLFMIIREEDPSITMTVAKGESPVFSMKQLTPVVIQELGNYAEGFSTTMISVDGEEALHIQGTTEDYPETYLSDFYIIHNYELYSVLFAVTPKERFGEYEDLVTTIIDSFVFSGKKIRKEVRLNDAG